MTKPSANTGKFYMKKNPHVQLVRKIQKIWAIQSYARQPSLEVRRLHPMEAHAPLPALPMPTVSDPKAAPLAGWSSRACLTASCPLMGAPARHPEKLTLLRKYSGQTL